MCAPRSVCKGVGYQFSHSYTTEHLQKHFAGKQTQNRCPDRASPHTNGATYTGICAMQRWGGALHRGPDRASEAKITSWYEPIADPYEQCLHGCKYSSRQERRSVASQNYKCRLWHEEAKHAAVGFVTQAQLCDVSLERCSHSRAANLRAPVQPRSRPGWLSDLAPAARWSTARCCS